MKRKHSIVFIVAAVAATMLADFAVGEDFPEPSVEELAAIDTQLADAFVAYAKTPAGRDNSTVFLEASEVFRHHANDEGHIRPVVPKSRELAAALATADTIAIAKLNILAQHAPLPRIAALYRNIALVFVERSEMDNPIGLPPMKFLPPAPDRIIPKENP